MRRNGKIQLGGLSNPNCFATTSWPLTRETSSINIVRIETSSKKHHFVTVLHSGGQRSTTNDILRLHPRFGTSLGLKEDEQVTFTEIHEEPTIVLRANIACVSPDDWEILESNAEKVTNELLNQLRVVYSGLEFPFFVTKSMSINLKIESIFPSAQYGILIGNQSEIIIPSLSNASSSQIVPLPLKNYMRFRIHPNVIPDDSLNLLPSCSLLVKNIYHAFIHKNSLIDNDEGFLASLLLQGEKDESSITLKMFFIESCHLPSDLLTYFPVTNPPCVYFHPGLIKMKEHFLQIKTFVWIKPHTVEEQQRDLASGESRLTHFAPLGNPHLQKTLDNNEAFKGIVEDCSSFIESSLSLGFVNHGFVGFQHGSILIEGKEGSGKTWLAEKVAKELSGHPYYVNWELINCAKWRGKKAETIEKEFKNILETASAKSPSLIILDDFDVLVPMAKSEQENLQEEFHLFKMCETFMDCLLDYKGEQLALICTALSKSNLNSYWHSKSGFHFFHKIVCIPPPNQVERLGIFWKWFECYLEKPEEEWTRETSSLINTSKEFQISSQRDDNDNNKMLTKEEVSECLKGIHDLYATPQFIQNLARKWAIHSVTFTHEEKNQTNTNKLFLQSLIQEELRFYDGNSNAQKPKGLAQNWDSIPGLYRVKEQLVKVLQWPIKYGKLFRNSPIRLPSGILLYGYPGSGKTLIGLAISTLVNANFIHIKGPELLSKYIGASEQNVQDVFKRARNSSPCIIFFDEFDSLVPRRGHDSTGVTDRVVNQFLSEMDGIEGGLGEGVYLVGATSRPDLIDPAVLRPGRLDKHLFFDLPTKEESVEILKGLGEQVNMNIDYWDEISDGGLLEGLTGADIHSLVSTAQLAAVQRFIHKLDSNEASSSSAPINNSLSPQKFTFTVNQEITTADVPVTKEDLLQVLSTFKPSLQGEELANFKDIYDNFSGGGSVKKSRSAVERKRATLA